MFRNVSSWKIVFHAVFRICKHRGRTLSVSSVTQAVYKFAESRFAAPQICDTRSYFAIGGVIGVRDIRREGKTESNNRASRYRGGRKPGISDG